MNTDRTITTSCRLSQEDRSQLDADAAQQGLSSAAYLKKAGKEFARTTNELSEWKIRALKAENSLKQAEYDTISSLRRVEQFQALISKALFVEDSADRAIIEAEYAKLLKFFPGRTLGELIYASLKAHRLSSQSIWQMYKLNEILKPLKPQTNDRKSS